MSFLRFIARSLVASTFIADGINKVRNPGESAADAEDFTNRLTPLVQRVAPAGYSSWVPDNAESWVKATGALQVAGGVMFATGIGRRLGALLLAKASILDIAIALPSKDASKAERQAARPEVLTKAALLGSALLAARDTQGKPGLSWRAGHTIEKVEKKASHASEELTGRARKAAKRARKEADQIAKRARKETKKARKSLESVIS
ncbi:DoxX family protein [Tessaracoccus sp. OS52]|uniref:DoxX family protein n=1 Tax=Tessaracoccus sp. OS52 TaxID=2886691 RepID=UPI001D125EE8|nr:DoxX family protein [Tessaracoccus sp. OS52]MCC2593083.1 DoxX family protein [Tessaracoccus sp. OS52]